MDSTPNSLEEGYLGTVKGSQISARFQHGGIVVVKQGQLVYEGGQLEPEMWFDEDRMGVSELLWALLGLGYKNVGPLYGEDKGSGLLCKLVQDRDVTDYLAGFGNEEDAVIYVDSPYDDLSQWKRMDEEETKAQVFNCNIIIIGSMIVDREPKEEGDVSRQGTTGQTNKVVESFNAKDSGICGQETEHEQAVKGGQESEDSEEEEESEDDDSDYEDPDASDLDAYEELELDMEKDKENEKRKKELLKFKTANLGPVGVDKGLEKYLEDGNEYGKIVAGDEEYLGSSDIESLDIISSEDEEEAERTLKPKIKTNVYYDPKCKEPLWELGMIFKNVEEFRDAVVYYAVKRQVNVHYVKNDRKRCRVRCSYVETKDGVEEQCPWLLLASIDQRSGNWVVKNYWPVHTCQKQNKNRLCTANFIAKQLRQKILRNPGIKLFRIQEILKEKFGIYKGKTLCRRAKEIVMQENAGDYTYEFSRLYDYRDCILQTNPGSTCVIEVDKNKQTGEEVFKSMYICFEALKQGFKKGCRKFFGLDGCFLKGVCKGQLLSAVARNGNHQIYPIAWAVVHTECTESWTWFLELLRKDLDLGRGDGFAVMTDMQKGLEVAITNVLPAAEHRECARHIISNWAKKYGGGIEKRKCFWRIAKSTFQGQCKDNLDAMRELRDENMVKDLLRYNIDRWSRAYMKEGTCCDSVENNVAESFNSWILAARYKSIISMLEEIRRKVMGRHGDMIKWMDKWATNISPVAYKTIEKNAEKARHCSLTWNGDVGFEVADGDYGHIVNISKRTCDCRAWALKGIPCQHAIVAFQDKGLDPLDYVAHWYHKETYIKAYSDFLQPMPNLKLMPHNGNTPIQPPPIKPIPGRPKRNRRKPDDELKKIGKESRKGKHVRCSYCQLWDHNKKSCELRKSGYPPMPKIDSSLPSKGKKKGKKSKVARKETTTTIPMASAVTSSSKQVAPRVISRANLKSAAVVIKDLGYSPKKRKWRGKDAVTHEDLVQACAKKRGPKKKIVTEEQRQRAALNKAIAEQRLAARMASSNVSVTTSQPTARVTRSQAAKFSSQPT